MLKAKKNIMTYILVGALIAAGFLVGSLRKQVQQLKEGNVAGSQTKLQAGPSRPTIGTASVDDDPVLGDENAPITMIEFSDYECPFCKSFYDQTLSHIKNNYINTGKVKFVYRDLPLAFHNPMASKEAIAANCARAQGGDAKYFEYHNEIFNRTASNGNGLNDDNLESIGQDLDLNLSKFSSCLEDDAQDQEVKKDLADASAAGATGTPTFVIGKSTPGGNIDGQLVVGAQPYAVFEAIFKILE